MFVAFRVLAIEFQLIISTEKCFISNVYDPTSLRDKPSFLHSITRTHHLLSPTMQIPGRDFNLTESLYEKRGGIRKLDVDSTLFQELMTDLHLVHLATNNGTFTWNNCRGGWHQNWTTLQSQNLYWHGIFFWRLHFSQAMAQTISPYASSQTLSLGHIICLFYFEIFQIQHLDFQENIKK